MPSKPNRKAAASKAAATRKRNAIFAKRSAAARKGWATRRKKSATKALRPTLRKPRGRNKTPSGKPRAYKQSYLGATWEVYDFRGLGKRVWRKMFDLVCDRSQGHYIRAQAAATDQDVLKGLYKGVVQATDHDLMRFLFSHKAGKPFFFWTPEYGPIASPQDCAQYLTSRIIEPGAILLQVQVLLRRF